LQVKGPHLLALKSPRLHFHIHSEDVISAWAQLNWFSEGGLLGEGWASQHAQEKKRAEEKADPGHSPREFFDPKHTVLPYSQML
jgi:hypothetical protein